jgi:TPR repeat protein
MKNKIIFFLFIPLSIQICSSQVPFWFIGNEFTNNDYKTLKSSYKYDYRNAGEGYLKRLTKKQNISQLKKIGLFHYYDELKNSEKHGYAALKGRSFKWFEAASSLGDLESKYNLGVHYNMGYGTKTNHTKAFAIFQNLEKDNFIQANEYLGYYYYYGLTISKDINKGASLLLSVENHILQPTSCLALGDIYSKGHLVKKDTVKAIEYYYKSAIYDRPKIELLDLWYINKEKVTKVLEQYNVNINKNLRSWYRYYLSNSSLERRPELYYDYAIILLESPYSSRSDEETQKALDLYKEYKNKVQKTNKDTNTHKWLYGWNLYQKNYLRGEPSLALKAMKFMCDAAENNSEYARELSNIYRSSAYAFIKDIDSANYWDLKASFFENSDSNVPLILGYISGNGVGKNMLKAYQLTKSTYSSINKDHKDFNNIFFSLHKTL